MGGLIGHVVAGTMFILISVWWFIAEVLQRGRRSELSLPASGRLSHSTRGRARFKSTQPVWHPCPSPTLSKIPVEPLMKVILAVIGVLVELPFGNSATLFNENGDVVADNLPNYGHAMMYGFFGLSGVVDLVMWYNILPLPPKFDYLALSFAFWMEGLLFSFHLSGRSELDVQVHTILYIIVFVTAAVFFLAAISDQLMPFMGFVKAYLLSLQGTWFIQVGFVLRGPHRWENTHSNVEFAGIVFAFHALALFVLHLTGNTICYDIRKRQMKEWLLENSASEEADCNLMD